MPRGYVSEFSGLRVHDKSLQRCSLLTHMQGCARLNDNYCQQRFLKNKDCFKLARELTYRAGIANIFSKALALFATEVLHFVANLSSSPFSVPTFWTGGKGIEAASLQWIIIITYKISLLFRFFATLRCINFFIGFLKGGKNPPPCAWVCLDASLVASVSHAKLTLSRH